MSTQVGSQALSISAEFLTGFARGRVLDGEPEAALDVLLTGLQGITVQQATAILDGSMRLTDVEDDEYGCMDLAPDTTPERETYLRHLDYLWASCCRLSLHTDTMEVLRNLKQEPAWWRPVAVYVMDPDKSEMPDIIGAIRLDPEAFGLDADFIRTDSHGRCVEDTVLRYLQERVAFPDEIVTGLGPQRNSEVYTPRTYVFWRKCNPPDWLMRSRKQTCTTPCAAFAVANGQHRVRGRGVRASDAETARKVYVRYEPKGPRKPVRREQSEVDERLAEEVFKRREAVWLKEIREQADSGAGWMTLTVAGQDMQVPRGAFEQWTLRAVGRTLGPAGPEAAPWNPVCPFDLKQIGDSPCHSDWLVAIGMLDDWHSNQALQDAAYTKMVDMQIAARLVQADSEPDSGDLDREDMQGLPVAILVPGHGGILHGVAVHPGKDEPVGPGQIAILPNASVDYGVAALTAQALIVEMGGALAHVSTVAMERGSVVVRLADARTEIPAGAQVTIDLDAGRVFVSP